MTSFIDAHWWNQRIQSVMAMVTIFWANIEVQGKCRKNLTLSLVLTHAKLTTTPTPISKFCQRNVNYTSILAKQLLLLFLSWSSLFPDFYWGFDLAPTSYQQETRQGKSGFSLNAKILHSRQNVFLSELRCRNSFFLLRSKIEQKDEAFICLKYVF